MNPAIRNRFSRIVLALVSAACAGLAAAPAIGVTQLHRGDTPPPIELTALDGRPFTLSALKGRAVVLLFGELYHEKSLAACRAITEIQRDARLADAPPVCAMIVAQQADAATLRKQAADRGVALSILLDKDRAAGAAYQVSVLPSVIVVDPQGHVVHALAGISSAFKDILTDAILLAAGQLSESAATGALVGRPTTAPAETSESRRAVRLTELARQLARGGMDDLAAAKYREALQVDPGCVPALLGLGGMAVHGRRLAEAEKHFREALAIEPTSPEAALGLASVLALRGGGELPQAENHVRSVLAVRPNDPEAHYLLGMILEQSGKSKEAMASYRRAAELLLHRGG
jgi:tetratricopeptide (TPR) repeat protein